MAILRHTEASLFVGRRHEFSRLAELRGELEGHRDRARHLVVVEGFRGVGATRFVEEFLCRLEVEDRSFTARGAYTPASRPVPLAPILEAIDALLATRFNHRRLINIFADHSFIPLLRFLPLVRSAIDLDDGISQAVPDPELLAALLAGMISQISRFRPIIVSIDNLGSIPDDDLPLLITLNLSLRNDPVLLVATLRRKGVENPLLFARVEGILRETISLPPLEPGEIASLIALHYGRYAGSLLGVDIARASGGLPQQALDLLRGLVADDVLRSDDRGGWGVASGYHPDLLRSPMDSDDRIAALEPTSRTILTLLRCAGLRATRFELVSWIDLLMRRRGGAWQSEQGERGVHRLEEEGVIRPLFSDPGLVTLADEGIADAERRSTDPAFLDELARMIVSTPELHSDMRRWGGELDLVRAIVAALPDNEGRGELFRRLADYSGLGAWDRDTTHRAAIFRALLDRVDLLLPSEQAFLLVELIDVEVIMTEFVQALEHARELDRLTMTEPSCRHLRATACIRLALSTFYVDRTADVADLLGEGERELAAIVDPADRLATELLLVKARLTTIPVDRPGEAVDISRKAYQLSDELGLVGEKYNILGELILRVARLRDEEGLRKYCDELLRSTRAGKGGPPIWAVSNAIRAALNFGDIFLARELFAAWGLVRAPLEPREYVAHAYLTTLFALNDGEPVVAAQSARAARAEVARLRAAGAAISYELAFNDTALQVYLVTSLVCAGHYADALDASESILEEIEGGGTRLPDVYCVIRLYRAWLGWRILLEPQRKTSLAWGGDARIGSRQPGDPARALAEFRRLYADEVATASPPPRFIMEMLRAEMEGAIGNFAEAFASLDRGARACEQLYSWRNDIDCRASRITLLLRQSSGRTDSVAEASIDEAVALARDLLAQCSERGMTVRIERLIRLFIDAGGRGSGRDVAGVFGRLGSTALSTARIVLRNSRGEADGPIEQARLSVMGPLRLMRPHSYLELTDTAFGRETARTLLLALVSARLLDRRPSREELAGQLSQRGRDPEGQKKLLYNAASAARAACGSAEAILNIGSGGIELNTDPESDSGVWVDALEIRERVERGEGLERSGRIGDALDHYRRALLLGRRGEFGVDCYLEWIDTARDRMRELLRRAAIATATIALRSGQFTVGIDAATAHLLRDPYDEEAHRLLIRLYAEGGNRSAALKQFEKCRALIHDEFGVEPEPETARIYNDLVSTR